MRRLVYGCGWLALALVIFGSGAQQQTPLAALARARQAAAAPGFNFAVIGDSGTGSAEQLAVAHAMEQANASDPFELVLMLGDNFYGGIDYVKKFERPYEKLLAAGVKFYASLGNHDGGKSEKETAYAKFNMEGQHYYSITRGQPGAPPLAQFFALDSSQMDQLQLTWLSQQLSQATARWKVAFFHHPLYSSGKTHDADLKLRALLEPLFVKHGVQLVLSGHDHFYERLKPQQGVHYFISGAAGKIRRNDIRRNDPAFDFGNDQELHFMLFTVTNNELRFRAIGAKGAVLDSGSISAPADNPTAPAKE